MSTTPAAVPLTDLQPLADWSKACAEILAQAQLAQLEALRSWQDSIATPQEQWWDDWTCRWAGGVPIDG